MSIDRKKIKSYFQPSGNGAIPLMVIGAILLVISNGNSMMLILGVGGIALGGWLFAQRTAGYTDAQIDGIVLDEVDSLGPRALDRSQLTPEEIVPPGEGSIIIFGPKFEATPATVTLYKLGKDKALRTSVISVASVNFTQQQLVVYTCSYDLLTGNPLQETTSEYFYRDVVGIKVQSRNIAVHMNGQTGTMSMQQALQRNVLNQERSVEVFELTTTGGSAVTIPIPSRSAISENSSVDARIQTMRRLLREKKAAVPG